MVILPHASREGCCNRSARPHPRSTNHHVPQNAIFAYPKPLQDLLLLNLLRRMGASLRTQAKPVRLFEFIALPAELNRSRALAQGPLTMVALRARPPQLC